MRGASTSDANEEIGKKEGDTLKPLTKEEKNQMTMAIQRYFAEEREEEIGELAAINILEFITKNLGSYYYNQGVRDSRSIAVQRSQLLEEDLFALEKRI
ncbi:DUF2164 domain-containing protein [Bacillus sp. JZ35]|uniref:Uncharacterized protein n=1 Tax=Bacillus safensis TaxID=561879 RepID=A0A498TTL1_BACIA|nr:DUF2164 domain-containing protein [Bacillus safensis]MCY7480862.1 DUF2164 domain-containing protein [Bacillus safensis]MCY7511205.1 DUF2164 domain-containing protein [Bacillus safensis]MCY7542713.1 DUF2164 domain-containing protein [Bacillus safensis]MCY7645852.1 DUF2164 domain-containing protein [Bacillus safensis]MCY7655666.1 DUF2164 domain-containing protein [Bacillus safensis]